MSTLHGHFYNFLDDDHQLTFLIIDFLPKLPVYENPAFNRRSLCIMWTFSLFSLNYISKFFLASSHEGIPLL